MELEFITGSGIRIQVMQGKREKVGKLCEDSQGAEGFAGLLGPRFNRTVSGGAVLDFFFFVFFAFSVSYSLNMCYSAYHMQVHVTNTVGMIIACKQCCAASRGVHLHQGVSLLHLRMSTTKTLPNSFDVYYVFTFSLPAVLQLKVNHPKDAQMRMNFLISKHKCNTVCLWNL